MQRDTTFIYIESTIPAGVTIDAFRRARPRPLPFWRLALRKLRPGT
jgi:hypothetical protein